MSSKKKASLNSAPMYCSDREYVDCRDVPATANESNHKKLASPINDMTWRVVNTLDSE
jgi:hypothetical protein